MKQLFAAFLCCCLLLAGCGQKTTEVTEPVHPSHEDAVVPVEYRWGDYVNITMELPEGWEWEATDLSEGDGEPPLYVGFGFWKTDTPGLRFTFECWPDGFGMCGTGVEFDYVNGIHNLTLAEEQGIGVVAVTIIFNDVPGSYVVGGSVPNDLWAQYRNTVVDMVDSATVAEGCMTKTEAVAIATEKCNWLPDYEDVYGNYNAVEGSWRLHFASGPETEWVDCWVSVTSQGKIAKKTYDAEGTQPLQWNSGPDLSMQNPENLSPTPRVDENS